MKKLNRFFQQVFSFSNTEARGFTVLLILCIAALASLLLPGIILKGRKEVCVQDVRKLDSLVNILERNVELSLEREFFYFDPNVLSVDSLILLGMDRKVAQRLRNYCDKGGKFLVKTDVKRIYGFPDQLYDELKNYIALPDRLKEAEQKTSFPIDINGASADQLRQIPGNNAQISSRIVAFREALGGFISEEQFEEVYNISPGFLKNLKAFTLIESGFQPRKIKINALDREGLAKHPYISDKLAADIVRYREVNNRIESEKVLANFKSVDKSNFKKLILYLDFQ
ncbi:MAG: helix-hairpin-helix domain-containing protein [Cytophagales bacterium]|nr:helix-hairpin-helix domain-containing protein [Cytophagales bacterium]